LSKRRDFVKFLRHFVKSEWVKHIEESNLHLCDKGFVDSLFKELESDIIYYGKVSGREIGEGDVEKMRTGLDILFDNREEDGYIKAAVQMLKKGRSLEEVAEILDLTDEQIKMVEERMDLESITA